MTRSVPKVLVIGSNGFIGKNLLVRIFEENQFEVLTFVRGDDFKIIDEIIKTCDFIVHLAGVNRPENVQEFEDINVGLTQNICNVVSKEISRTGRKMKLIYASSTQAESDNLYGRSKRNSENLLIELNAKYDLPICIYRFPGVFGKWCRPNYNSVVSTFCYNIARDIPIKISDPDCQLNLIYIDDLISNILQELQLKGKGLKWGKVLPEYQITLGDLAKKIQSFRNSRDNLVVDPVGTGFNRALYSTFVSYLPKNLFKYSLKQHSDERGNFVEMLKTQNSGQISFFTSHPGVTRGGHYHHTKTEKFLVIRGKARFRFRDLITNEIVEIITSESDPEIVDTIPGWAHNITNVGECQLIVMLWANENFDKNFPDTIKSELV